MEEEIISFVFQFVHDDGLQCSGLELGLSLTLLKEMESNIDLGQHLRCHLSQQKPCLGRQNWMDISPAEIKPSTIVQKARQYCHLTPLLLDLIDN